MTERRRINTDVLQGKKDREKDQRECSIGRRGPSCQAHQLKIHTTLSKCRENLGHSLQLWPSLTAYLHHQPLQTLTMENMCPHTHSHEKWYMFTFVAVCQLHHMNNSRAEVPKSIAKGHTRYPQQHKDVPWNVERLLIGPAIISAGSLICKRSWVNLQQYYQTHFTVLSVALSPSPSPELSSAH